MTAYISMLRGINVSGQKQVRMDDLRRAYSALGLTDVASYVQSGNVVFTSLDSSADFLAARIEAQIETTFGYRVPVFIRRVEDFRRILDSNPFLTARVEGSARLYVTFLYRQPTQAEWGSLKPPANTQDEFAFGEQEVYLFCPGGYGTTKLNNTFFEKKMGIPTTTRNWNTVNALYALAEGLG